MMDCVTKSALEALGEPFSLLLSGLSEEIAAKVTEISIRLGRSLCVNAGQRVYFITKSGEAVGGDRTDLYRPSPEELSRCLFRLCDYSLHAHQKNLTDGYLTVAGGHRAGICGNAVFDANGRLCSVRDITSLRLRVARPIPGAVDPFSADFGGDCLRSVLFAGPPGCGKTTLLRDLAAALSSGRYGRYRNVVLADERCELSAFPPPGALCLDVIRETPKSDAVLQAVRTLRPDMVICDEIGSLKEAESFITAVNCGVAVAASIHAGSCEQLAAKPQYKLLAENHVFDRVYFIQGIFGNGYRYSLYRKEEP